MNKKLKIASIMLYIVSGLAILFGIVYIFTPKLMPYHEKFLGFPQEELDPRVMGLFLFFLKGAGAAFLSIGVSLLMLIKGPFRKGDTWARKIILTMSLISLVPLLIITLNIGLHTPWWLVFVMIILVLLAMYLSKPL